MQGEGEGLLKSSMVGCACWVGEGQMGVGRPKSSM